MLLSSTVVVVELMKDLCERWGLDFYLEHVR